MDSLKAAADKIMIGPKVVRKKINKALGKDKLNEEWIYNRENVQNGVTFNVKVLGQKPATNARGEGCTEETVQELVQRHKLSGKNKKLQKVSIMVDNEKLIIRDLISHGLVEDIPVRSMSYCTADPTFPKIFALIAREKATKQLYTHAFLTNKKSIAAAIALTVAQAFSMAFEELEEKSNDRKKQVESEQTADVKSLYKELEKENQKENKSTNPIKPDEIDEGGEKFTFISDRLAPKTVEVREQVDEKEDSDEKDEFSIFVQSRSNTLNTGIVRKQTFKGDVTDLLAVNNTLNDLTNAKSTEDLFMTCNSSVPEPIRPFEYSAPSSAPQEQSGNLIEF